MIAYTAWDGLHAIATQVDADLTVRPDGYVSLAPHRSPAVSSGLRRLATRLAPGLVALVAAVASSTT
jgi:hypothetical protein